MGYTNVYILIYSVIKLKSLTLKFLKFDLIDFNFWPHLFGHTHIFKIPSQRCSFYIRQPNVRWFTITERCVF